MRVAKCRHCKYAFKLRENVANVMCPNCKKNINLFFEELKSGVSFKCGNCENLPKN